MMHTFGMKQAHVYFAGNQDKVQLRSGQVELSEALRTLRSLAERGAAHSPKVDKLVSITSGHFGAARDAGEQTKAIVFASTREAVKDVMEQLQGLRSFGVIPSVFVGQGEAANKTEGKEHARGQTQKEQQAVMQAFRRGEINVLVATCIGEEGLDVSEVDLVVFYDCVSITRMVQRMGRCGRSRAGKCFILASEGKEREGFEKVLGKFNGVKRMMADASRSFKFREEDSPRMLPAGYCPVETLEAVQASPWCGFVLCFLLLCLCVVLVLLCCVRGFDCRLGSC